MRSGVLALFFLGFLGACSDHFGGSSQSADYAYFRVMWNEDAATTATIGWSSSEGESGDLRVYYDTVDRGTKPASYAFSQPVSARTQAFDLSHFFVRLQNLSPKTTYYFVISNGATTSKRFWFETASGSVNDRISLIAGGDSRNNREPRRKGNLLAAKLRAHAILFGGDMTDGGTTDEWKEWLEDWQLTISPEGRITPVVFTRGNHEAGNQILVSLFDTPSQVYYAVKFGGNLLRVYTLNSEASIGGNQTAWLQSDLASSSAIIWKIAQYHTPMRPHTQSKPEGNQQYAHWAPLFHQYKMDLVIESDTHTVKSTWPIRPDTGTGSHEGFIRDDQNGTVYIGEGCWGSPLRSDNDVKPWTRDSGSFNHFNWIFVSQNELTVRTIPFDGAQDVAPLTSGNRFTVPGNLPVWNPPNGGVITLSK